MGFRVMIARLTGGSGDDRRVALRSGDRGGRAGVNLPVSTFPQTVSADNEGLLIEGS